MQAQVIAAEGEQKASQALKEVRTMLLFFLGLITHQSIWNEWQTIRTE